MSNHEQHLPIARFLQTPHADLINDYFKFTFTRNPYDRLYSGYLQDRYASESSPRWNKEKKPIFDKIGEDFATYLSDYVTQSDIATDWRWICFCPMTDFVGRAERLEEDMTRLANVLGLEMEKAPDESVRPGKCTDTLKYLHKYDRRNLEIVNEVYADDFTRFGYEMINPDTLAESNLTSHL